jgi:DNA-binding transcriptional LysR family regulator
MDLRQLSYFVAVAEVGQFTRAAVRVSVAQPAISAQIGRLERELGEPLFHRDQRGVTLSGAGEALLPHARAALAAAERGRDTIASLRGVLHGRLRIGVSGPGDRRLAATLGAFHRAHPAIEITLTEQQNAPLLEAVAGGDVDAALVGMPDAAPPQVRTRVIATDPLVLAVRRGDPLSRRGTVTLRQLRDAATPASRPGSPRRRATSDRWWSWPQKGSASRSCPAPRPAEPTTRPYGSRGRGCNGGRRSRGTRPRRRPPDARSSPSRTATSPSTGIDRRAACHPGCTPRVEVRLRCSTRSCSAAACAASPPG